MMESDQLLANFPLDTQMLKTKNALISFAKNAILGKLCFVADGWKEKAYNDTVNNKPAILPEDIPAIPKIVKLSLCIISDKGKKYNAPKWYTECNGKIWWDDLNPGEPRPF